MYTYEVIGTPPMCKIIFDGKVIDNSGPWESKEAAERWAEAYTNKLNAGLS
jgi:hypothetical protein